MKYLLACVLGTLFGLTVSALLSKWFRWSESDGVRALRPKPGMPEEPAGRGTSDSASTVFKQPGVLLVPFENGEVTLQSDQPAFRTKQGAPLPIRAAWGDLPYEELAPMFLDQFLLRYFPLLMPSEVVVFSQLGSGAPWKLFTDYCPWAKEMPLLFEQLTGYKLNDRQLNEAIGEYISRLEKLQRAATPGQRETPSSRRAPASDIESRV